MTEATCIVTRVKWPETDDTGSVGTPIPNIDMKYVYCLKKLQQLPYENTLSPNMSLES